jgi:hypothetical protein
MVIAATSGYVTNHLHEVLGIDIGTDRIGIGVFGGTSNTIGGQQDSAFEDKTVGVGRLGEAGQKRFEYVPDQVFLCRCTGSALCCGRPCGALDMTEDLVAAAHVNISSLDLSCNSAFAGVVDAKGALPQG